MYQLNKLLRGCERICFKNVVFQKITKESVHSQCRYLTLKNCSNLQNLDLTRFDLCEQANLVRCEMLKETLKIFGENLKVLQVRRTFSVDTIICKFLAYHSPFKNLKVLDLSYNQIELSGFILLIADNSVFAENLQKLSVERNIIVTSLPEIVKKLNLLSLKYLDLNLNQIEWEEDWLRRQGFHIVRKYRERKFLGEKEVKVKSVDIAIDDDLYVRVMNTDEIYKY